jgi:hypothetical protein
MENPHFVKINKLLAEWNPIGVPETVRSDEYKAYVDQLIKIGPNNEKIVDYLKKILIDRIGLNYSDDNESQREELILVANKIFESLK